MMTRVGPKARLALASAMVLALAACDDRGGPVDAPEPASLAELSAMSELPYAEAARVEYRPPEQGYAWAERAYGLQRAVYDTPPDYGFYYDDVEPLVWETDDDWVMYAEPWDEGYRYYYYEPGAHYPYFVRDDRYGYGYGDGGVLIAVFDLGGRYLPRETVYSVAPVAGRYYARGHALRTAAIKAPRIRVTDQAWSQRAPQVIRTADPWLRAARDDRGWRAWRERDQDRELRRFEPEAKRRAERTRDWRERADRRELAAIRDDDRLRRQQVEAQRHAERGQAFDAERQQQALNQRRERVEHEQRRQLQMERAEQQQAERVQQRTQVEQRQRQAADRAQQQHRQQAQQQQRLVQEHERRQAEQAQQVRRQQQVEQQAQRRQAVQQQQRERAQQAQQQQRQAQQERQQAQQRQQRAERQPLSERQPQARSAQQQGQPAASRERGGDHRQGRGPHDRKD